MKDVKMKSITESNMRLLIQEVNSRGITQDQIVEILHLRDQYILVYYG